MQEMWKTKPKATIEGPEVSIHLHQDKGELMVGVLVDVSTGEEGNWEVTAPLMATFLAEDYDNEGLERVAQMLEAAAAEVRSRKA